MVLRLIRIYHRDDEGAMLKALEEIEPIDVRFVGRSEGGLITEVLVEAERSQKVLDTIDSQCGPESPHRVIVIALEATLPRPPEEEPEEREEKGQVVSAAVEEMRVDFIGASKPTVT